MTSLNLLVNKTSAKAAVLWVLALTQNQTYNKTLDLILVLALALTRNHTKIKAILVS